MLARRALRVMHRFVGEISAAYLQAGGLEHGPRGPAGTPKPAPYELLGDGLG